MGEGYTAGDPALATAYRRTGLAVRELWFRYLALGGNLDEVSVEGQLYGLTDLPRGDYNVLAHALNEALDELPDAAGAPRVAYRPAGRDEQVRRRIR